MSTTATVHAKAIELAKLVLRMTSTCGSGHPSSALSLAHITVDLMYRTMRYDPADPWNPRADRLVLSEGHTVPIIYAAYADLGGAFGTSKESARPLTIDDLLSLRQRGSALEGHPNPAEGFPFFDAATGSLGQGLSVGAGLALAARLDGIDKRIFVLMGDGESREGQVWEAMDFIVDHKIGNVCAVFSCNGAGQAGKVSPQQSPQMLAAKIAAFGWDAVSIDGHDPQQVALAMDRARRGDRPLAVVARTVKGWGVELLQIGNQHGKPVPKEKLDAGIAQLDAMAGRLGISTGEMPRPEPCQTSNRSTRHDDIALPPLEDGLRGVGLESAMNKKQLATRAAYGAALVAMGRLDERVVSLDGDVCNSTYANLFADALPDRFYECKIAEQNMISVAVGLAKAGKIPFASSFAKFLARGYDQVELASITRANIKLVGSHSGVSLAADGPSQMSLHDVAYFRSMTRVDGGTGTVACHIFHPADAVCAYRCTELVANIDGLCYLRTHRPAAPFLYDPDERFEIGGCKQLRDGPKLTLVSAGYLLHTVLASADELSADGIPCNVFDAYSLPLNATPILEAARRSGGVVLTVEDNYSGGLHAELAEAAAAEGDVRVYGMTCTNIPKSTWSASEEFEHVGVGRPQIIGRVRSLVNCE